MMEEDLDGSSLKMDLQYAETPIVFMKLETYDAFKELVAACRVMQERLLIPWQKDRVTGEERTILEALRALDKTR